MANNDEGYKALSPISEEAMSDEIIKLKGCIAAYEYLNKKRELRLYEETPIFSRFDIFFLTALIFLVIGYLASIYH